jgi:membrane protease YdiL (CAAX protease family)
MSLAGLLTVGAVLQQQLGLFGVVVSELAIVFLPAWLFASWRKIDLAIDRPRATAIAIGAVAGLVGFVIMALVEEQVLERVMPLPPEVRAQLKQMIPTTGGARVLAAELVALALAPAIAEETMFRGMLLGAFGARRWIGAIVAAVAFGAYHASVWRLIPATLLGLALGAIRVRTRSLWPAIAFHLVNNAAVITMARTGRDRLF